MTPIPPPDDDPVVLYLAALEARRSATDTLPKPHEAPDNLAHADMVEPPAESERDALRRNLAADTPGSDANIERLEPGFVEHADDYGRRHQITYEGWRAAGVDEAVLARAGIRPPTR